MVAGTVKQGLPFHSHEAPAIDRQANPVSEVELRVLVLRHGRRSVGNEGWGLTTAQVYVCVHVFPASAFDFRTIQIFQISVYRTYRHGNVYQSCS